jgi:hypothetical protein
MEEFVFERGPIVAIGKSDTAAWIDYRVGNRPLVRRVAIDPALLSRVRVGDQVRAEVNFFGTRVRNVWKGRLLLGYDGALPLPPEG